MKELPKRRCKFCGRLFIPNSNYQLYCKGPHIRICPVCHHEYEETNIENLKRPPHACSYACRAKRTRQTSLKKYGTLAPGNNPEAREKAKATCQKNYGVPYAMQSEEIRQKAKDTLIQRYGVDNAGKDKDVIKKRLQTNKERYGDTLPFNKPECYEKQHQTMIERYGVPYFVLANEFLTQHNSRISKINVRFHDKLALHNVYSEYEYVVDGRLFDIFVPESKTLIEIDPSYTHSTLGNHWNSEGISKWYHKEKSNIAHKHGFNCVHVWDSDDWDKIVDIVTKPILKIYAKDCKIFKLHENVGRKFIDLYDVFGNCRKQILFLGLVYNDDIVQIMSVGSTRYNDNYDAEILKMCTKSRYQVVGGFSKLFKFLIDFYELDNIITYNDDSKFRGTIFENLGMKCLGHRDPEVVWRKDKQYVTERARIFMYHKEKQELLDDGWLPVYDCGQTRYEYRRSNS